MVLDTAGETAVGAYSAAPGDVAGEPAAMMLSGPGSAERSRDLDRYLASVTPQAAAALARAIEVRLQAEQVRAEARALRQLTAEARRERRSSPAGRQLLHQCEALRLLARLETMAVIEQAKGILMAQACCGEAEAFDMLRRTSQRSNVPVREQAAQIVARQPARRARRRAGQ
jgi:ANTAR domain